jgi:hypothetical protein
MLSLLSSVSLDPSSPRVCVQWTPRMYVSLYGMPVSAQSHSQSQLWIDVPVIVVFQRVSLLKNFTSYHQWINTYIDYTAVNLPALFTFYTG